MLAAPVGDEHPLEAPALAQYAVLRIFVFAGPDAVDLVVARHHRQDAGLLHRRAKRRQVDFVQRPVVDMRIDRAARKFLVVEAVVLDGRRDVVALHAAYERHAQFRRKDRILAQILPVAPSKQIAHDDQARLKSHYGGFCLCIQCSEGIGDFTILARIALCARFARGIRRAAFFAVRPVSSLGTKGKAIGTTWRA